MVARKDCHDSGVIPRARRVGAYASMKEAIGVGLLCGMAIGLGRLAVGAVEDEKAVVSRYDGSGASDGKLKGDSTVGPALGELFDMAATEGPAAPGEDCAG